MQTRGIVALIQTIRTLIKLVLVVLRYFKDISTTTGTLDRISCLKRVPHMIWVDDFKNWIGSTMSASHFSRCLHAEQLSRNSDIQ